MRAVLGEVDDTRRQPTGVHAYAQGVHRWSEQFSRYILAESRLGRPVSRNQVPAPVRHDGRKRLVPAQQLVERLSHRSHLRRIERSLSVDWRVSRGQQHRVAFAQRHVELLGEVDDQLPTRLRASRLDEAQVARRYLGLDRKIQLAETAALSPVTQQVADSRGRSNGHEQILPRGGLVVAYLAGN